MPPVHEHLIREATAEDAQHLLDLMRELARYERLEHIFETDLDSVRKWILEPGHVATAHVAEAEGGLVGYSVSYLTFSTFLGQPGIWLEDLFVLPDFRGRGIGKALLGNLAGICRANGYPRLEWSVLDWNQPSIDFYRSLGADALDEWTEFRLTGAALTTLAGTSVS